MEDRAIPDVPPVAPALSALLQLVRERGWTRRDEPFQLSSGGWSHDYVDLRRAVARGSDLKTAAEAVLTHAAGLGVEFDVIGGMTMGADPVAHAVALLAGKSWFSVRKAAKTHGRQQRIEGAPVGSETRVLLFEDTVSTGSAILESAIVLQEAGAPIVLACTLLDRGDAGARGFAKIGVRYAPLLTYADLGIDPLDPLDPADAPHA